MAKFRCKRCNYQIKRDIEAPPRLCPNCGEAGTMNKEQSADELLMDSG